MGWRSVGTVRAPLQALVAAGLIELRPRTHRNIVLITELSSVH